MEETPTSPSHKRKNSNLDDGNLNAPSSKAIKLENVNQTEHIPLEETTAILPIRFQPSIPELENFDAQSHIFDLYKFITSELMLSRAPVKIQELIDRDPKSRDFYKASIQTWIDEGQALLHKTYTSSVPTNNFQINQKYLADIETLSHMSHGLPLAFELALYLCQSSYVEGEHGNIYISRPVAKSYDCLVHKLCLRMKNEESKFEPVVHLLRINDQRKFFAVDKEGLTSHLLFTRDLLVSWVEGPPAVQEIHDETKKRILSAYHCISGKIRHNPMAVDLLKIYNVDLPKRLISSLKKSIPQAERLSYMAGGKYLAFDLLLFAGRHSFIECDTDDLGRKIIEEFHKAADSLLLQISRSIRQENPAFRPVQAMEMLHEEIETTKYFGYFPRSYKLFLSWMPEVEKALIQQAYDDLRTKISNGTADVERRLEIFVKDGSRPTSDLLGRKMCGYVGDINKLSNKLGGLFPAIEMAIFLGECSYTKMEGLGPLYGWDIYSSFKCKREFDKQGDHCLKALLQRVQKGNLSLNEDIYNRMKRSIEYLKLYDINTYFRSSYRLICQLLGREDEESSGF